MRKLHLIISSFLIFMAFLSMARAQEQAATEKKSFMEKIDAKTDEIAPLPAPVEEGFLYDLDEEEDDEDLLEREVRARNRPEGEKSFRLKSSGNQVELGNFFQRRAKERQQLRQQEKLKKERQYHQIKDF